MKSQHLKDMDGWKEVLLIDPITSPLAILISKKVKILWLPILVSLLAFLFKFLSAFAILHKIFVLAVILYLFSDILDGLDGKIARLQNNENISKLHGRIDIIGDSIGNAIILFSLFYIFRECSLYIFTYVLLLYIYEVSYAIRIESRWREGDKPSYSMKDTIETYKERMLTHGGALAKLTLLYSKLLSITSKFRTYPNPTLVDSEFVLFVIFPLIPSKSTLIIAILFLLPDVIISLILTFVGTRRW